VSFNANGAAPVSVTVFGGLCTESAAVDLPEGVSPDTQETEFLPGSVFSRRGLSKVFATPFGTVSVTYAKSFVTPTGDIWNLYLDSAGNLWKEHATGSNVYTLLQAVQAGTYAKSITAFGREYIAISDCLHGAEVPLQWDGTNLDRVTQDGPGAPPTVANLLLASVAGNGGHTLVRNANVVTATTAAAHGLKVGYQAQIAGIPAQAVNSIAKIVVNNQDLPGIATVTLSAAHGLAVGQFVTIQYVPTENIGGGVTGWSRSGNTLTVNTVNPHNLSVGAVCNLNGLTGGTTPPNGTLIVVAVPNSLSVTFSLSGMALGNDTSAVATGNIQAVWPFTTDVLFEVLSCPTTTSFQVQANMSDATFDNNGGAAFGGVFTPWDGTFYVASVPSATTFTYLQQGPSGDSGASVGTITPFGQMAPGQHSCQVIFLTRNGYTTRPSPPVQFQANGGQYLNITNIPLGPPNVVARILSFTGAGGSQYFYIPIVPQVNGQIVGTATQINDNTTTSITLDFGDNTLFSGLGINIPGNTLANQIVIDGALGFGLYAGRLLVFGMRNRVQNFLNFGFEGGGVTTPLGWAVTGAPALVAGDITGNACQFPSGATIQQSAYQDAIGAPILQPNTQYTFRCFINAAGGNVVATISSASTGFSATATIVATVFVGKFTQNDFSLPTPASIPADMVLTISAASGATIDEISIIYTANPYLDGVMYASYAQNPEAFDGVTGKLGPSQDTKKIMDLGVIRASCYAFTQDPGGRVHQFSDNGVGEPASWTFNEVASNCGLISAFALTKSQADDGSASGGEEFLAWLSATGPRIFDGSIPCKIGQEIAPDFQALGTGISNFNGVVSNPSRLTAWALNSPDERLMYFGLPIDIPNQPTAFTPNRIYTLNYRELDTAAEIASSPPVRTGFTGKLIATDRARKWSRWNVTMNGAALLYRFVAPPGTANAVPTLAVTLFGGDSKVLGTTGHGNVYTLSAARFTDDDYGLFQPWYVTYFVPSHDQEAQLSYRLPNGQPAPIGAGRKLLSYLSAFIAAPAGMGSAATNVVISFLVNSLTNVWPISHTRPLIANPTADLECAAGSAQGQRIAIKLASVPQQPGVQTDNGFQLSHLTIWIKGARVPVRGAA
jgi:hypothetical protein